MTIDLPFTTYSIERTTLGIIVVSFDVLIVISFFISFYILGAFERQEEKDINKHLLTTEDFAIVVKTLPSHHDYNSLKELKALKLALTLFEMNKKKNFLILKNLLKLIKYNFILTFWRRRISYSK